MDTSKLGRFCNLERRFSLAVLKGNMNSAIIRNSGSKAYFQDMYIRLEIGKKNHFVHRIGLIYATSYLPSGENKGTKLNRGRKRLSLSPNSPYLQLPVLRRGRGSGEEPLE